jgi:hypothetical protein
LGKLSGLKLQPKVDQTPLKISHYYDPQIAPSTEEIVSQLRKKEITANVIMNE